MQPYAYANIIGNASYPNLIGYASFYPVSPKGTLIEVEVRGLPNQTIPGSSNFYGMHIHENGNCTIPFDQTGNHYNPSGTSHPQHAGDLPPLLGNEGYGFLIFYTNRFDPPDILHRSIIIHSGADDFRTQPSGDSGSKIACGIIEKI